MTKIKRYRYALNKRKLQKWLKESGYTYKDLADELEIESDYLEDTLANGCGFDEDINKANKIYRGGKRL